MVLGAPLTRLALLLLLLVAPFVSAQANASCNTVGCYYGGPCDPTQGLLQPDGEYHDPCGDVMLVCQPSSGSQDSHNGTCTWKGCANSDYIPNWNSKLASFPQRCNTSSAYCPDSGLACQPLVKFGGACEEARDDECLGTYGMCLNLQCVMKTVGLNGPCGIESIGYRYAYKTPGQATTQTIERDNCTTGFYCDSNALVCITALAQGQPCTQDRVCASASCSSDGGTDNGQCIAPTDSYRQVKPYVYGIIGAAVATFMFAVLCGLWFLHRIQSNREHEKSDRFFAAQASMQSNNEPGGDNDEGGATKVVLANPKAQIRGSEAYNNKRASQTPSGNPSPSPLPGSSSHPSQGRKTIVADEKAEGGEYSGASSSTNPHATQPTQRQSSGTSLQRKPSDVMPGTGIRYGHREQLLYATATEAGHHHHPRTQLTGNVPRLDPSGVPRQ